MNNTVLVKFKTLILILTLSIFTNQLFSQTSDGIFFQAVARDNFSNAAKDRKIFVQTSIIQTTATGTKVLTEEHQANTDATGVFNITIGNGKRIGGIASSLSNVDWSKGPFFLNLKVSITPIGANSDWDYTKEWIDMGTTSFGAVPFSFYAANVAGFDTKLNVSDTAKMLSNYAKTTSLNTLTTNIDTKLATKLNIADSTKYVTPTLLAAKTFDQTPITNAIATKLNIADSTKYVTPTQLAAKTFDQTPITNAIATKLNIADSTKYVTPTQLAAKTFDQTPITNAIATKLNIADSTIYVTPTQLAAKTFDQTPITNAIATKLNIADSTIYVTPTQLAAKTFDTTSISNRINLKLDASLKGTANGVASLNASGIIPSNQLPPVSLSSTSVVGSDADMIALSSATVGSIAIRTDVNKNYVLSALPASVSSNWIELLTPAAPVQTVNGYTGSINLTKSDFGLDNVDNTSDVNKPISNATKNALDTKAVKIEVDGSLAQKMNITDANIALAAKSNTAEVNAALATKISTTDATAALNSKLDANKVGALSGVASLDASGKIPTDQIPAISFSSVKVLGSEAEMLALSNAVIGSVVIRTDENKNYVLAANNPSILANWKQLLTPAPPVQSVNGLTGNITLSKSLLDLGNVENTSDANKPISALTQTALNAKADITTIQAALDTKANGADVTAALALKAANADLVSLSNTVTTNTLSTTANTSAIALKANIASPTFTGTVNASSSLNTGQIVSASVVTAKSFSTNPIIIYHINSTNNIKWDPSQGLNASVTLDRLNSILTFTASGSTPLTLTTPPVGSYGTLVVSQDATGSRSITLPTNLTNKILGSTSTTTVTLSTAPNSKDILNFYYDGTTCYWNLGQGYGSASSSGGTNLASGVSGTLAVANGGTGSTTLTGIAKGNGTNAMTAAIAGTDYQAPLTLTTTGTGAATLSGTTLNIPAVSSFTLPTASGSTLGGVKVGTNLSIDGSGVLSADINAGSISGTVAITNGGTGATTLTGLIKGNGTSAMTAAIAGTDYQAPLTLTTTGTGAATLSGTTLNIPTVSSFTLPTASGSTLGGVKVGTNLSIDGSGVLSANISAGSISGTVAIANGGTGATTATAALTNLGAAPLASPTFTGTVTTSTINTGALSATSINTPIYASTPQTLSDAATISWNPTLGLNASVTLGGSRTLSFSTAPASGAYGTLVVKQDASGGRTLTLPSVANKILGSSSTTTIGLSTTANAIDIINFYFDGTNYFWNVGQGYGSASSLTASNIAGGAAGSIPYQTASGATSLLAKGTDGQILTLASGLPSWSAAPVTGVSTATSPLTISGTTISLTTVPVSSGGTGATTLTGYVKGNGTNAMTASATIPVADVTGAATIASPSFTGTPTAVTATPGTNTTQIATTAFVSAAVKVTTGLYSDEINVTTQTGATPTFTLTYAPLNNKIFMYINGTRIKNGAYTVSGVTVTYTAANNNSYTLVSNDRVQFDYAY